MALRVAAAHARRPDRRRRGPHRAAPAHPGAPERQLRRRSAADAARGALLGPARLRRRAGHRRRRWPSCARSLSIVSPERIQGELSSSSRPSDPGAASVCSSRPGLIDLFLPEVPALRLEVDEHHHHKDVYEHSLTVLRQAIELEDARGIRDAPDLPLRLAALLHDIGKPATRKLEPGGGVTFHHHDMVGAARAQAPAGAAVRLRHHRRGHAADRAAPALLRLRRGRVDRLRRAPVRAGCRRPARAPAHPHPGRRDDAQPAQGRPPRRRLRRHRAAHRRARRGGGARAPCGPSSTATHPGAPRHPARAARSARRTASCSTCASTRARSATEAERERLRAWWAARED